MGPDALTPAEDNKGPDLRDVMPQASAAGPGTLLSATRIDRLDAVTPGPAQRRGLQGLPRLHIHEPDAPPDAALSVLTGTFLESKVQVSVAFQDSFLQATTDNVSPTFYIPNSNVQGPRPHLPPTPQT